jgi:2-keto-4-pentenoate hydratase/2-oxohepta-3-ene-1,7-dioic acid hydratase in catechol pathway
MIMETTRRAVLGSMVGALSAQTRSGVTRYVRYRAGSTAAYGVLDGNTIRRITGNLFGSHKVTSTQVKLSDVQLLHPCEPPKILAVGLNYKSHIGNRPAPKNPEIFYKPITALQNPEGPIVIPKDAKNVHYEGELVLVIGKRVKGASVAEARGAIFGVTCGNDVSERDWQNGPQKDLQWWRAKGADTFAPLGPAIAHGLDYGKLLLQTRLNGEVVQKQYTSDLLFDPPTIVSWVSQFVTLTPGDLIYTGTPGSTKPMKPRDVVEVEIEGVGILRNRVS